MYARSLEMILASEQMARLNAAGFPNLKDNDRKKYYKTVEAAMTSNIAKEYTPKSTEDLYNDLVRKFSLGG